MSHTPHPGSSSHDNADNSPSQPELEQSLAGDESSHVDRSADADDPPVTPRRSVSLRTLQGDPAMLRADLVAIPYFATAGYLLLLVAREKRGKSTLARFLTKLLSRGGQFLGRWVDPRRVLYVALDESRRMVARSLTQLDADAGRTFVLSELTAGKQLEDIAEEIDAVRPTLVVIDALAAYTQGKLDENNATGVSAALLPLRKLAEEKEVAILMLHHSCKDRPESRGSTAIDASADQIIVMDLLDGDEIGRTFESRGRLEGGGRIALRMDPATGSYEVVDVPPDRKTEERGRDVASATRAMLDYLRANPGAGKTDVTARAGMNAKAARALFDDLVLEGTVLRTTRG